MEKNYNLLHASIVRTCNLIPNILAFSPKVGCFFAAHCGLLYRAVLTIQLNKQINKNNRLGIHLLLLLPVSSLWSIFVAGIMFLVV